LYSISPMLALDLHSAVHLDALLVLKSCLILLLSCIRALGMFCNALHSKILFPFKFNYRNISRKVLGDKKSEVKELLFDYMVTAFSYKSKAKACLGLPSKFSDEQLSHTKAPILLMIGQNEVIYGSIDATVERARKLISNIQTEIIPDAGHLPNIDQPEIVNSHILEFLQE
jgi:pimeloyl-ACP methyl ester carboxylesterase